MFLIDMIDIDKFKAKICDSELKDNIVCLLFYGSMCTGLSRHRLSDYDFHLVFKNIDENSLRKLKEILSDFGNLDLSIHQLNEIINQDGAICFQNGTQ